MTQMYNYYTCGVTNSGSRNTVVGNLIGIGAIGALYSNASLIGNSSAAVERSNSVSIFGALTAPALTDAECTTIGGQFACQKIVQSTNNTCFGQKAGFVLTSGSNNCAVGFESLTYSGINNSMNASYCTAVGNQCIAGAPSISAFTAIGRATVPASADPTDSTLIGTTSQGFRRYAISIGNSSNSYDGCINIGHGLTATHDNLLALGTSNHQMATIGTATAGSNGVLPANVAGFLTVWLNNVQRTIPLYLP